MLVITVITLLALTVSAPAAPPTPPALQVARGFSIEQRDGYRLLRVCEPWRNAGIAFHYALVPRGRPLPAGIPAGATVVRVPVERVVLLSTATVSHFDALGLVDRIAGIADGKLVNTASVARRIAAGKIAEVGTGAGAGMGNGINIERLFMVQPDLVIAYATGKSRFDAHPKLIEAGFTVALEAAYMEETPLGRAEWIRFIAAFFNADRRAAERFRAIQAEYACAVALTADIRKRPRVFVNIDFNGTWYVPGGKSFMATFVRDAGGDYLWQDDDSSGGIPLSVESVITRARNADVWLNPGLCASLRDIRGRDERYTLFRAIGNGRVYNHDAKVNRHGGNDYWETGAASPHLVLKDLIRILHPDLLPEHRPIWYRRLE